MKKFGRRTLLLTGLSLLGAGCLEQSRGGEALAKQVESPPPAVDPTPYPQPDIENSYITAAIEEAAQHPPNSGWWSVNVPPADFPDFRNTFEQLPSTEGHNPYVTYDSSSFELSIAIYS